MLSRCGRTSSWGLIKPLLTDERFGIDQKIGGLIGRQPWLYQEVTNIDTWNKEQ